MTAATCTLEEIETEVSRFAPSFVANVANGAQARHRTFDAYRKMKRHPDR
jgi:hypothetical protein